MRASNSSRSFGSYHWLVVASLLSLFAASNCWVYESFQASSGYVGSKWYIQWGSSYTSHDYTEYFAFPTAFPTACVYVGLNLANGNQEYQVNAQDWNRTHFWVNRSDSVDGSIPFTYMAIGYDVNAPDNLGDVYGSYQLNVTNGFVRLNTLLWQWTRAESSTDVEQTFPLLVQSVTDMGHIGLNLRVAGRMDQMSVYRWLRDTPVGHVVNFTVKRDDAFDGSSGFQVHAIGVNPEINGTTPHWSNETFNCNSTIIANLSGLWLQTSFYHSTTNGFEYFAFPTAFPAVAYHIGVNQLTKDINNQLSATGWNNTHFWINRANDFQNTTSLPFTIIALGH